MACHKRKTMEKYWNLIDFLSRWDFRFDSIQTKTWPLLNSSQYMELKLSQENLQIKNKKNSYRTQIHSLGDVLGVIKDSGREGIIVSVIGRKANLSHYPVLKKCDMLRSAGLIEYTTTNQNKVFTITEKGLRFIQEYHEFKILVESLNLRY